MEELAKARTVAARPTAKGFLAQGATFARRIVADRLTKADLTPVSRLARGEGKILDVQGQKTAVFRDDHGDVHAVAAKCTHMGCLLDFNGRDRTWDCACHGSRFGVDGDVLHGPAKRALDVRRISVEATPDGDAA